MLTSRGECVLNKYTLITREAREKRLQGEVAKRLEFGKATCVGIKEVLF